jgi:hedgehog protein
VTRRGVLSIVLICKSNILTVSESAHPSKDAGCFTAAATLQLESGRRIPMSEVRVGQRVAAMDSATGRLVYSEVLLFLDRDPDQERRFVTLLTDSGSRLSLTETHLIHVLSEDAACTAVVSPLAACFRPVYAGNVAAGQRILVAAKSSGGSENAGGGGGDFRVESVVAVSTDSYRGLYAPLTAAGTLVVDSVVASCYAVIDSQSVAHAAFAPLRWWSNARQTLRHALATISFSSSSLSSSEGEDDSIAKPRTESGVAPTTVKGVHWYADLLYSLARWTMPRHMVL